MPKSQDDCQSGTYQRISTTVFNTQPYKISTSNGIKYIGVDLQKYTGELTIADRNDDLAQMKITNDWQDLAVTSSLPNPNLSSILTTCPGPTCTYIYDAVADDTPALTSYMDVAAYDCAPTTTQAATTEAPTTEAPTTPAPTTTQAATTEAPTTSEEPIQFRITGDGILQYKASSDFLCKNEYADKSLWSIPTEEAGVVLTSLIGRNPAIECCMNENFCMPKSQDDCQSGTYQRISTTVFNTQPYKISTSNGIKYIGVDLQKYTGELTIADRNDDLAQMKITNDWQDLAVTSSLPNPNLSSILTTCPGPTCTYIYDAVADDTPALTSYMDVAAYDCAPTTTQAATTEAPTTEAPTTPAPTTTQAATTEAPTTSEEPIQFRITGDGILQYKASSDFLCKNEYADKSLWSIPTEEAGVVLTSLIGRNPAIECCMNENFCMPKSQDDCQSGTYQRISTTVFNTQPYKISTSNGIKYIGVDLQKYTGELTIADRNDDLAQMKITNDWQDLAVTSSLPNPNLSSILTTCPGPTCTYIYDAVADDTPALTSYMDVAAYDCDRRRLFKKKKHKLSSGENYLYQNLYFKISTASQAFYLVDGNKFFQWFNDDTLEHLIPIPLHPNSFDYTYIAFKEVIASKLFGDTDGNKFFQWYNDDSLDHLDPFHSKPTATTTEAATEAATTQAATTQAPPTTTEAPTCTVPTINPVMGTWNNDCSNGASVSVGITCTITSASGYSCTSPGVCGTNGQFGNDGVCNLCAPGYGGNGYDRCVICDVYEYNAGQSDFFTLCANKNCPVGQGVGDTEGSISNSCEECTTGHFSASSTTGQCSPHTVVDCDAGEELTAGTTSANGVCNTCADGNFQPENDTVEPCSPHTVVDCDAGEELTAGTTSANGVCNICETGKFQPENDSAGQCSAHTVTTCDAGEELTAGTTSANGVCNTCADGKFQPDNGSAGQCFAWNVTSCDAGEELTAGSASADGVCDHCAPGYGGNVNVDGCVICDVYEYNAGQSDFDTLCANKSCPVGQGVGDTEGSISNSCQTCTDGHFSASSTTGQCSPHTVTSCDAGKELTAGTTSANGVCNTCADGKFQPENESAGQCSPHTVTSCDAGEELTAGTTSANGVCNICETGKFQPENDSAGQCSAHTVTSCDAGEELTAGTTSANGVCNICETGNFQPYDNTAEPCSAWNVTSCDAGYALSTHPSTSTDGACDHCAAGYGGNVNVDGCVICDVHEYNAGQSDFDTLCANKSCPVGQGVGDTEGSISNSCQTCTDGHFSASSTTGQCSPHTVTTCDAGEELTAGTSSVNGVCTACTAGNFQPENESAGRCSAWNVTSCNAGYELTAGSASADGVCTGCGADKFQPGDNTTNACSPHTVTSCDAGEELTAGTTSANGVCNICETGKFQPDDNTAEPCSAWNVTSCNAGYELTAGSASADGVCDHCAPGYGGNVNVDGCVICDVYEYNAGQSDFDTLCANKSCPVGQGVGDTQGSISNSCQTCTDGHFSASSTTGQCSPHTVTTCDAGEELTAGTTSANGVCNTCETGKFQPDDNTVEPCSPHTVTSCDAGEELTAGTTSANGVCNICETGKFQPENDSAGQCSAHTVTSCDAGEELTAGSTSANGVCNICETGNFQPEDGSAEPCSAHNVTSCDAGEELTAGSTSADGVCNTCAYGNFQPYDGSTNACSAWNVTSCDAGYELAGSASADGVCNTCADGNFQPDDNTTSACSAWNVTSCNAGYELTTEPSASANGVCTDCADGNFQPDENTTNACSAWNVTTCDTGYALSTHPSTSTDGACNYCAAGYGGNRYGDGCVICDVYEYNAGQSDFDTLCANKSCPVGKGVGTTQGSISNSCEGCTAGHFSASDTTGQCSPHTVTTCDAGEELTAGTTSANGVCTACADGNFQPDGDTTNACSAHNVTSCDTGYELTTEPSASADGVCNLKPVFEWGRGMGTPTDGGLTEQQCKDYGNDDGVISFTDLMTFSTTWWNYYPTGCSLYNNRVYWNSYEYSDTACGDDIYIKCLGFIQPTPPCVVPSISISMGTWNGAVCSNNAYVPGGTICELTVKDGYACTSPGECTVTGEFEHTAACTALCTVPTISAGVGSWSGDNCSSGATDVLAGTTCTITEASGYSCTSPGLCKSDGTGFEYDAACTALCTVPTISAGVGSWSGDNCVSGATDVLAGTTCTITEASGYSCTSPGLCKSDGTGFEYDAACTALCTVPTISAGVGSWSGDNCVSGATDVLAGTTCTITEASGYSCTSPGLCKSDGTGFEYDAACTALCTVPTISAGVGSWSGDNCVSGATDVLAGTTCTITEASGYSCTSPGLCKSDGTGFEYDAACTALCTVPTIDAGVSSWSGDNCSSGATDVLAGTTCTITEASGYSCTSPGLCKSDGTGFEYDAACTALCTVPTISAGVGSWSGDNCVSGATDVLAGTTCTITEASGYSCTSPGLCKSDGTGFEYDAACTALCTVPTIDATMGTWNSDVCSNGAIVQEGTICGVTPKWNYACTSPGECGSDHNFENTAAACTGDCDANEHVMDTATFTINDHENLKEYWQNNPALYGYKKWRCIASSADGTKLVAAVEKLDIWTSIDSGATWTRRDFSSSNQQYSWHSIASSEDGTKLAAIAGHATFISDNSGETWEIDMGFYEPLIAIAMSADGTKLAVTAQSYDNNNNIYTSINGGADWTPVVVGTPGEIHLNAITMSADGTKLAVTVWWWQHMDLQQQRRDLDGRHWCWCDETMGGYRLVGRWDPLGGGCESGQNMDFHQQWRDLG